MNEASTHEHLIIFQPSGRQGRVPHGMDVLQAARSLGVEIESICAGKQTCGKCAIAIETGAFAKYGISSQPDHATPTDAGEVRCLADKQLPADYRLSCTARVLGDLVIRVPEESQARKQVVRKAAGKRDIVVDPAVRLHYVEIPEPDIFHMVGDWERLRNELQSTHGLGDLSLDPSLISRIQPILRKQNFRVTAAVWQGRDVIQLWPGYHEDVYGLAVDVGTTTVAGYLCHLRTGEVVATESIMNPQVPYGEDLMSRVSYTMTRDDGVARLHEVIINGINELAARAAETAGIPVGDIVEAVLVGNTIMHHLLLGVDPIELGGAPFTPAVQESVDLRGADLGLKLASGARVHFPPIEAGHVGSDNVATLVAEAPHAAPSGEFWLVIDVGTNGELLLGNRDRMLSASSPTGPAFEGAQIVHGMRAAPGAIERIRIDPETLEVNFKVIGEELWSQDWTVDAVNASDAIAVARARRDAKRLGGDGSNAPSVVLKASGICGSGVIEAVAELFLAGLLDPSGRFMSGIDHPRFQRNGPKGQFVLAWPHQTSTGRAIVFTSDDIRAIQLGKAALYTGARLLMHYLDLQTVDRIHLAGGFGSYIDPFHAAVLGLIPDCERANVRSVGNSAGDGARMLLLNRQQRHDVDRLARWVEHINTAVEPAFQDEFVASIHLPHARDAYPHLTEALAAAERNRLRWQGDATGDGGGVRSRRRRQAVEA